jgi:hypothetical protein
MKSVMLMNFNEETWKDLSEKFSSYEGTVTENKDIHNSKK